MKKILLIIDNTILYDRIKNILNEKKISEYEFIFMHSYKRSLIWEHIDFKGLNKKIDVKNKIHWIQNTFSMVFSIHCLQFFPKELVSTTTCINLHPGYNPINRGWYPQVFSIYHNLIIGATLHIMDEKLDNGPIIDRIEVEKLQTDTSATLYKRVLDAEVDLFEKNIFNIISRNFKTVKNTESGNIFLKKVLILE